MEAAVKRKQLSLNISKCSLIVFQKNTRINTIGEAINNKKQLSICNTIIEAKEKDVYLGDILHEGGLSKSALATVTHRYGRIFSSMIEVSSILDDYRIDTIGGMKAGLEIYELALLPSLLNNADTWIFMDKVTIQKLENLQNTMFRNLFAVPISTPTPMLRFDLGSLSMKERIDQKKLGFLHHLKHLESESLAAEMYELQVKYNFPGLITECRKLLKLYKLPNIIDDNLNFSKLKWKSMVKSAVKLTSEMKIKQEFKNYSKLKNRNLEDESLKLKQYVTDMNLRNARTNFRIRSFMVATKMNRKSDPKFTNELWRCNDCCSMDSQSHILWCPAYAPLREGKNLHDDLDLVKYFQAVMKIREDSTE